MNTEVPSPKRKISILLFVGVFLLPIVFVWFLLRQGYSRTARVLGFCWFAVCLLVFVVPHPQSSPAATPTATVQPQSLPVTASGSTSSVSRIDADSQIIKSAQEHVAANKESLKKYYASADQVKRASEDVFKLTAVKVAYEKGKTPEEKALSKKAAGVLQDVVQQSRELYASSIEESFIKSGMDARVKATGKSKEQLRITYSLMSKPLVYKLQNEVKIDEQAKVFGFTKIVLTNGFESSLGQTWTIDL
jgi:hypothetical protein